MCIVIYWVVHLFHRIRYEYNIIIFIDSFIVFILYMKLNLFIYWMKNFFMSKSQNFKPSFFPKVLLFSMNTSEIKGTDNFTMLIPMEKLAVCVNFISFWEFWYSFYNISPCNIQNKPLLIIYWSQKGFKKGRNTRAKISGQLKSTAM